MGYHGGLLLVSGGGAAVVAEGTVYRVGLSSSANVIQYPARVAVGSAAEAVTLPLAAKEMPENVLNNYLDGTDKSYHWINETAQEASNRILGIYTRCYVYWSD